MNSIFNYTLAEFNETSVRLHRQWINTTSPTSSESYGADLWLTIPPESSARLSASNESSYSPTVDIVVPQDASNALVNVAVVTNETSLTGLDTQQLFLPPDTNGSQALQQVLQGLADGNSSAAQQVCTSLAETPCEIAL